ncbi:YuiB family protein [Sporosarcina obsidiansis]|uniref:YuiB family protein n=1 Tax=Sporosarcina obsidiansis TaxID=2660748 RepID=UPI00129BBE4E|nr:YuiB family protein [Sporosarcina obsidiansis]
MQTISIAQVMLSILIFMVMFFGIGFLLNMLLRMTWLMAIIYPIVVIFIIDDIPMYQYVTKPGFAFSELGSNILSLHMVDIVILSSGLVGAIISGFVMKALRKQGYQMF